MEKHDPFKYFKISPEIIQPAVMLHVRFTDLTETSSTWSDSTDGSAFGDSAAQRTMRII
jgi:hypothetical protein